MNVLKAPRVTRELQTRGYHHTNHQISWLSLRTTESPVHFSEQKVRLSPSGVPTESNPLLSLDTCIENANSVHFAYLKCATAELS